jgi:D-cysteine desulfhydrase
MLHLPPKLDLARLPTPLQPLDRLSAAWGGPRIWVKRDDLTGFGVSGNKIRKLEFHLAAAIDHGAARVITCGAVQSNHCRATALAAAGLGLECRLLLRTPDGMPPRSVDGNHLLQRLAGAEVRFITPEEWERRDELLAEEAASDRIRSWTIPEGASDVLGMWGFAAAFEELADQVDELSLKPAAVWHAASSAGTTAGLGWGAAALGRDTVIAGTSVGEPAAEIMARVRHLWDEAGGLDDEPRWDITDDYVGDGYGIAGEEDLASQAEATRLSGLLFDPTYTGKALHALRAEAGRGRFSAGDDVVFWHTGGGFALFSWPSERLLPE